MIFETMSFIDNDIGEFGEFFQLGLIPNRHFVRGHDKGKIGTFAQLGVQGSLEQGLSFGSVVTDHWLMRQPLFKFPYPIG